MLAGMFTVIVLRCWVGARSANARCWLSHRASHAPPRVPYANVRSHLSPVGDGDSRLPGAPCQRVQRQTAACDFLSPTSNGRQFAEVPKTPATARWTSASRDLP